MDLKKTEELTVSKMKRTLSVILEYANSLALTDLEENRDKLKRWKRFSTGMAQYYCVEGHEANCDDIIAEKYTNPFERMLEGSREVLQGVECEKVSDEIKEEAINGINRYREDMLMENVPGYETDIETCSSLIEELSEWSRHVEEQQMMGM